MPPLVLERYWDRHEKNQLLTQQFSHMASTHPARGTKQSYESAVWSEKSLLARWATTKAFRAYQIPCIARIAAVGGCCRSFPPWEKAESSQGCRLTCDLVVVLVGGQT